MYWGPPTWIFIHTLAAKIKDDAYPTIRSQLIQIIVSICHNLPCPECTEHAKQFWSNTVKINSITTKEILINTLFTFHNMVNKRKKQPIYLYENLEEYNNKNLVQTFKNFHNNFHTKGNMRLLNESFHRANVLKNVRNWLIKNQQYFEQ